MKNIQEIRDKVSDFPRTKEFFQNNSFSEACFKLTNAIEELHLGLMHPNVLSSGAVGIIQDKLRGGYRETLKDAFKFCDKSSLFSTSIDSNDIIEASNEIERAVDFNQIRNLFEQCDLNRYTTIVKDDSTIKFTPKNTKRDFNADLYARWVDGQKIENERRTMQSKEALGFMAHLVIPTTTRIWDEDNQSPKIKSAFKGIVDLAYEKIMIDSEEQDDYDFGDFTLNDFSHIYSVIMALGVLNFNYHFTSRFLGKTFEKNKNVPIVCKKIVDLVDIILSYTRCCRTKIERVLDLLTYDPVFHKDKITIYQPLLKCDDLIYFSPMIVYFSLAQDKLLYLLKENKEHKSVISKLAKDREHIMTDRIIELIHDTDLLYNSNYVIRKEGKTVAEFDLPIYDEKSNKLLLVELKWFFKGDGEADHKKIDRKIITAIQDRTEKQKVVEEDIKNVMLEMFDVEIQEIPEIMSCIVSKNYSGSAFIEDRIPVFDELLFCESLKLNNFDLAKLFDLMKRGEYIPNMKSMGIEYKEQDIQYAGYRFKCLAICEKTRNYTLD